MPRIFVIFRTYDRIWTCKTLTRELAPFEMDMSSGPIKFVFTVDQISPVPGSKSSVFETSAHIAKADDSVETSNSSNKDIDLFYCQPHERLRPCIVRQGKEKVDVVSPTRLASGGLMRRFSLPALDVEPAKHDTLSVGDNGKNSTIYFVLPTLRCTLLLDAHVASCVQCEYSRSKAFRRRFMRYLRRGDGFRNCIPDYEEWTEEEKEAWEHYLLVPYLVDIVAVWPKQKIDYSWSDLILGNLNKHVTLEEGFAWLSTLGGAHSSLGETFLHHAKRAGEISGHQLRLALQLGNESLIARCHVFWSWSLLQRAYFKQCKACILSTWRFCKSLKARDRVLENMCKAVWSRLRYRLALVRGRHIQPGTNGCSRGGGFEIRDDSSDSGDECDRVEFAVKVSMALNVASGSEGEGRKGETVGSAIVGRCGMSEGDVSAAEGVSRTGKEMVARAASPLRGNQGCLQIRPPSPVVKVY